LLSKKLKKSKKLIVTRTGGAKIERISIRKIAQRKWGVTGQPGHNFTLAPKHHGFGQQSQTNLATQPGWKNFMIDRLERH